MKNILNFNFEQYYELLTGYIYSKTNYIILTTFDYDWCGDEYYVATENYILKFRITDEFNSNPNDFSTWLSIKYTGLYFSSFDNFKNDIKLNFIDENQLCLFKLLEIPKMNTCPKMIQGAVRYHNRK